MGLKVAVQAAPCGAWVEGVDLKQPLSAAQQAELRALWLQHLVLGFPEQHLTVPQLEQFATTVGPNSPDPFFKSIPGHPHVAQVRREANET